MSGDADSAVIVALGANLARPPWTPAGTLEAALAALPDAGFKVLRRSSLWRSAAWPDPTGPAYLNAVALVETRLDPAGALAALHALEARFGRVRAEPNAPRTLDLDLIAHGRTVCPAAPVLPHPRAAERLFVMGPLAEIAPAWRHPVNGHTSAELARTATVGRNGTPTEASAITSRLKYSPKEF